MKKTYIILLMMLLILVNGCSSSTKDTTIVSEKTYSIEELSKYTGKDGNPAYIAVDGMVYDVMNVSQWKNGMHNGFKSDLDLTQEIKTKSPHGISKLKGIKAVGKLVK